MIQCANRARFALESLVGLRVGRDVGRQHFDGDRPIEPQIEALIDLSHPALADAMRELIGTDSPAFEQTDDLQAIFHLGDGGFKKAAGLIGGREQAFDFTPQLGIVAALFGEKRGSEIGI